MTKILTGTLVVALFTGCGLSNTAGDTVSDGAVSGSAVSGGAVAPEKRKVKDQAEKDETTVTEVKNCLANDDNRYDVVWKDGGAPFLRQTRLDGSHKKKIEIKDLNSVCWVTNEWVYYRVSNEKDTLCRIPIKKTEQGDSLLLKKKEVVTAENYVDSDIYVTDTYIIYHAYNGQEKDVIYKLDLRTKEKKALLLADDVGEEYEICYMWGVDEDGAKGFPLMKSGKLFLCGDKVCLLDPETEEVKQLGSGDYYWCEVQQGKIWFVGDASIYLYDEKKEEAVCVLSQEQLRELLVQEGILGNKQSKRKVEIYETWYYQGRFYLEIYFYDKKSEVDVLLSFSLQNPEDIRNERTASDFIRKLVEKGYEYDEVCEVKDGKMLLGFWGKTEDEEDPYAVYDLDTKKIRRISEKEADRLFPE